MHKTVFFLSLGAVFFYACGVITAQRREPGVPSNLAFASALVGWVAPLTSATVSGLFWVLAEVLK